MAAISDYLEEKWLNMLRAVAYTAPSTWLALFTAAPSDSGGGTEVSGGSYVRKQIDSLLSAAVNPGGTMTNGSAIEFVVATGNWGTITHIGIFDASTVGNLLWHGALTGSVVINTGEQFVIPTGDLDLTLA